MASVRISGEFLPDISESAAITAKKGRPLPCSREIKYAYQNVRIRPVFRHSAHPAFPFFNNISQIIRNVNCLCQVYMKTRGGKVLVYFRFHLLRLLMIRYLYNIKTTKFNKCVYFTVGHRPGMISAAGYSSGDFPSFLQLTLFQI